MTTRAQATLILLMTASSFVSFTDISAQSRFFDSSQLSSSLVTSTIQDSKGFIWIGTEYGLTRFDGISMREYHKNDDVNSLHDNSIRDVYCDKEGRVWIGMITGMQRYDDRTDSFCRVRFEGTSYTPNVSHIIQLEDGRIWIIVSRLGLFEVDPVTMVARPLDKYTEMCGTDHINSIYEDSRQRIWIGTDEDGLFCIDNKHEKAVNHRLTGLKYERIDKIAENRNGSIVAACDGKIWVFDEVRQNFICMRQADNIFLNIRDMLSRKNGDFIIATTNHGIWKINEQEQSIEMEDITFPLELRPEKSHIVTLMEDNEENLWCGCFQRGLVMLPPPYGKINGFNFLDLSETDRDETETDCGATASLCTGKDGNIWCGTQDGSLFHLTHSGRLIKRYTLDNTATCLHEDSLGNIWIGMDNFGLHLLDRKTGRLKSIPELKHASLNTIIEGDDRKLYIGTQGDGIWTYDLHTGSCGKFTSPDAENYKLLRNSYINKLYIDSKNRLWIGHFLGASCLDLNTGLFLEISTDATLNASVGYALEEGRDGTIWIGTNNGLFSWKDSERSYEQITMKDGLTSNMICGIVEDEKGNIWCSTFRGINCLTSDRGIITSYYTSNGTSRQEYIQGIYSDGNRSIYFGDSKGITFFTPPIDMKSKKRDVIVTNIQIGNQNFSPYAFLHDGNTIKLTYEQNTIAIDVATMAIRDAGNIRFRYRLSGLDEEWYTTGYGENRITYNRLPSGKYTLEICPEENSELSPVKTLKIEIKRPWYRSVTAYSIYLSLVAAIIVLSGMGVRRKRKEEANEKKLRYYVNMAHEIRSPMVMILNPIEKLLNNTDDPRTCNTLNTIKRNCIRVIRLMNHFLDIQKLDKGDMQLNRRETDMVGTIKEVLETFTYEAEKRKIQIDFEHPLDKMHFNVDPDHIDTMISNLVTNALKYTPDGGNITVRLKMSAEYGNIEISVSDSGTGISEKEIDKVFRRFYQTSNKQYTSTRGFGIGLNLCQMLAELHGGIIKAENRTDRSGSIFTIIIPSGITSVSESHDTDKFHKITTTRMTDAADKSKRERKPRVKSSERILIIDDDDEIRQYIEDTLSPFYKVLTATDGDSGIRKALTEKPDLIISDIVMPGTDGFQLVKRIKNNSNTTHIPVMLLTSKADINDRMAGIEHGADAYMVKPFNIDELHLTIENLLKNRQRIKGVYSGSFQEDKIKTIDIKGNSDKLMEKIMKVINDNLDNPELKVEKLAEEVGLSRAQLHRRIKEMTGISTGEFIRNIRLKKAADLLSEKKINISQVAYMVGFSSQTHFSTAFRKFYGISPTEHINQKGRD